MTTAELNRLLANILRAGTIMAYNPDSNRVQVQLGGNTTDELVYFEPAAGSIKVHRAPSVGEACLVFCPSGDPAAGYVLCGVPTGENPSAATSPDIHIAKYADGAEISYNQSSGALKATGIKTANIEAAGEISLKGAKIVLDGEVEATKSMTVAQVVNANGGIAASQGAGGSGATVKIDVPVVFTKKIISTQIVEDGHTHIAPVGGGSTSKPQ